MTLPAPPVRHKLQACTSRFLHQLKRTQSYVDVVLPALKAESEDDDNLQYCLQTLVLMLHTFLEEHYRWLVSLASFWQTEDVRRHLMSRHLMSSPDKARSFEEMPAAQLCRVAAREVSSFKDNAKKLRAIFKVLFQCGPFADDWADSKCRDLVAVRNIITHQGGMAEESNLPAVKSPDVIVTSSVIGSATFYRLRISRAFMMDVLTALGRSVQAIDTSLKQDPRYRL